MKILRQEMEKDPSMLRKNCISLPLSSETNFRFSNSYDENLNFVFSIEFREWRAITRCGYATFLSAFLMTMPY